MEFMFCVIYPQGGLLDLSLFRDCTSEYAKRNVYPEAAVLAMFYSLLGSVACCLCV